MNYLSVDIGGTFIKFGLINHFGEFIQTWKKKTPSSLEDFQKIVSSEIQQHLQAIKGIAVSCPGRVDSRKGYIHTGGALFFLYDFPIKEWVSQYTSLPFSLINDGKAAALAEWWIGNLSGIENGAAIVLGTGVGGGLIIDNQLYMGAHFQAGELSFIMQNQSEVGNSLFGNYGSAVRFIHEATKILNVPQNDYLSVFSAIVSAPSPELMRLYDGYCYSIASLISNLQVILDLEKVVIGGGISSQDCLIKNINKQYKLLRQQEALLEQTFAPVVIEHCAFRNSANLLGALFQLLLDFER